MIGFIVGGRIGATVGAALGYAAGEAFGSGPLALGRLAAETGAIAGIPGVAVRVPVTVRGQAGMPMTASLNATRPDGTPVGSAIREFAGLDSELCQVLDIPEVPDDPFVTTLVMFVPLAAFDLPPGSHRLVFRVEVKVGESVAHAQVRAAFDLAPRQAYRRSSESMAQPLLELMVGLMRTDGRVEPAEVREIRRFFERLDPDPSFLEFIRQRTKELLGQPVDVAGSCRRLKGVVRPADRGIVLRVLFEIAAADAGVTAYELAYLKEVAAALGFGLLDFRRLAREYGVGSERPVDDHALLGLGRGATAAQIKAAYRKACLRLHPDRLTSRPLEERRRAQEEFIRIKEAYERLIGRD